MGYFLQIFQDGSVYILVLLFQSRQHYLYSSERSSCYSCINKIILWSLGTVKTSKFTSSLLIYDLKFYIRVSAFLTCISTRNGHHLSNVIIRNCKKLQAEIHYRRFWHVFSGSTLEIHYKQGEEHLFFPRTCLLEQNWNETDFPAVPRSRIVVFCVLSALLFLSGIFSLQKSLGQWMALTAPRGKAGDLGMCDRV